MKQLALLITLISTTLLCSCGGPQWDESTVPVKFEIKLVLEETPNGEFKLDETVLIDNADIARVMPARDPMTGQLELSMKLTKQGGIKFAEITEKHINERLAMIVNGAVYSAPTVRERISGGALSITLPDADMIEIKKIAAGIMKYKSESQPSEK